MGDKQLNQGKLMKTFRWIFLVPIIAASLWISTLGGFVETAKAQSACQWNYYFDASGNAHASYCGIVDWPVGSTIPLSSITGINSTVKADLANPPDAANGLSTYNALQTQLALYAPLSSLALYAPLASPALTGTPTAPTQSTPDNSTLIATDAFVHNVLTGSSATPYLSGGYINRFRDGDFVDWSRGLSALAESISAATYTAAGWIAFPKGAAFTCSRQTGPTGSLYALACVGGTSHTDQLFAQRIESYWSAILANTIVTVQFKFYQNTGSSVTPKLKSCYAVAQDAFNGSSGLDCGNNNTYTTTDLASVSLTACATATWCLESYTFTPSANASKGYEIDFDCNTALTAAQSCEIAQTDVRATPSFTNNAIPSVVPPAELRVRAATFADDCPYYDNSYDNGTAPGSSTVSSGSGDMAVALFTVTSQIANPFMTQFHCAQRAVPTEVSFWDRAGNASKQSANSGGTFTDNQTGAAIGVISSKGFQWSINNNTNYNYYIHWVVSTEL